MLEGGGELHFLFLDRNFDLITPLLHDFHYESLGVDLLGEQFVHQEDPVY